jgi:hypothetical protein
MRKEKEEEKKKREEEKQQKERAERERDAALTISNKATKKVEILTRIINIPDNPALLELLTSEEESKASDGAEILYTMVSFQMQVPDKEEHPLFPSMKANGSLEKIYEIFKGCMFPYVKTKLSLLFVNVHRSSEMEEKHKDMVIWLRDNINASSNDWERDTTLMHFQKHIYRFFISLFILCLFVVTMIDICLDCPTEMFFLNIHTFALPFLEFLFSLSLSFSVSLFFSFSFSFSSYLSLSVFLSLLCLFPFSDPYEFVIWNACDVLLYFFTTPKPFSSKEEVKKSIDKRRIEVLKNTPGKRYTDSASDLYSHL